MQRAFRPHSASRLTISLLLCSSLLFGGCTAFDGVLQSLGLLDADYTSAESMAEDALDHFNHGKYSKAFSVFEKLRDRYPFSQFSMLASLKKVAQQRDSLIRQEQAKAEEAERLAIEHKQIAQSDGAAAGETAAGDPAATTGRR